jgi:hypothetical protein
MNNAYFSFTDEYKQSAIPSGEYSNEVEAIYVDPLLFSSASEKADSKIEVIESVIAHEFTHMVRFNMKFVGSKQIPGYNTMLLITVQRYLFMKNSPVCRKCFAPQRYY